MEIIIIINEFDIIEIRIKLILNLIENKQNNKQKIVFNIIKCCIIISIFIKIINKGIFWIVNITIKDFISIIISIFNNQ